MAELLLTDVDRSADEVLDDALDEELAREALAADPDTAVPDDAVSIWEVLGTEVDSLLPSWYMPTPMACGAASTSRAKRVIVLLLVIAFLVIDAYGLCSTYGQITIA